MAGEANVSQDQVNITFAQVLNTLLDRTNEARNDPNRGSPRIKFPEVRAEKFHGEEEKFLFWKVEFEEMIACQPNMPNHHKVMLLKQHLSQTVKEQLCFTSSEQLPYDTCMRILTEKYCDPIKVRRLYRRKIQEIKGPASSTDYKGLDQLCMQMRKYLNALNCVGQQVTQIETVVCDTLVEKLPLGMYEKVTSYVDHRTGEPPTALNAIKLLEELERFAKIHSDVQTHKQDQRSTNSTGQSRGRGREERDREERRNENRQTTMITTDVRPYCAMCQSRNHWAEACKEYDKPDDRMRRFRELELCFKCAKKHPGGVAECTSTYWCNHPLTEARKCQENHHMALHKWYELRAAGGPPQGGNRGRSRSGDRGRSQSGDRARSQSGDRARSQSGDRNRSRSRSNDRGRVRFVDEQDRNQARSGNGYRRE